jgi:hypothetical protein
MHRSWLQPQPSSAAGAQTLPCQPASYQGGKRDGETWLNCMFDHTDVLWENNFHSGTIFEIQTCMEEITRLLSTTAFDSRSFSASSDTAA